MAHDEDDENVRGPASLTRRDFVKAGVVTAVAAIVPGCSSEPVAAGIDGGAAADGGSSDSPIGTDAGADAGADAGPEIVEPPEDTAESAVAFSLGVASGDVTLAGAICWTYYSGGEPLELVVWEMAGAAYARMAFSGPAVTAAGYVHIDATGLASDALHRFAFFEVNAGVRVGRSAIGRFRTPPLDDALVPVRFGAVSCISNMRGIETIGHAGAREDLSLFAFLGDSTYNDGAVSLAQYRAEWVSNIERPEFRTLRASTSAAATWDDHEFDNDYDPEGFDPTQRAAAVQAFFDHQPLRRDGVSPDRVYKRLRWGGTLELFVLDCRNERRPSTRTTPAAEYISREQMDWLKAGLAESTAVFKLILNSVPITDFPGLFDVQSRDRWEGYAAQRTEILSYIDLVAIRGVLWVAGDFHLASSQRVALSGPGSTQFEVLVGPAAQTGNVLAATLAAPQFDFATGDNNYAVIDLDPATTRATVSWVRGTGSVIQVREYDLG